MCENRGEIILRGKVVSGLGLGAKYVELYRDVIKKHLGIDPYPGTLNIDLGKDASEILSRVKAKIIPPPSKEYGAVIAYEGKIGGIRVYVLKPCITKHGWNIIEVISENNLRKELNLKDGDNVIVTIYNKCVSPRY